MEFPLSCPKRINKERIWGMSQKEYEKPASGRRMYAYCPALEEIAGIKISPKIEHQFQYTGVFKVIYADSTQLARPLTICLQEKTAQILEK